MVLLHIHTPTGNQDIDSDTVTDAELAELGITREHMLSLIPRDYAAEIDGLTARVEELESEA